MRNIVKQRKGRFGPLEIRLLGYAQMRQKMVVRLGELRQALGLTQTQERQLFSRLALAGTIVRIKRETYLLPPKVPLGGLWNPDGSLVLCELMKVYRDGRYQLCGLEVFRRYGFTEQVPNRLDVYNNRLCGDRTIGAQQYTFIKVDDNRLGGTDREAATNGTELIIPTLARALMDAVYDWSRFGTLPASYDWIRKSIRKNRPLADDLVDAACRYGNQGTIRRIGWVLDDLELRGRWKLRLRKALGRSASVIPLVPGCKACGPVNREWGVIENER